MGNSTKKQSVKYVDVHMNNLWNSESNILKDPTTDIPIVTENYNFRL